MLKILIKYSQRSYVLGNLLKATSLMSEWELLTCFSASKKSTKSCFACYTAQIPLHNFIQFLLTLNSAG